MACFYSRESGEDIQRRIGSILLFVVSLYKRKLSFKGKVFAFSISSSKKDSFQSELYVTPVLTAMQNEVTCELEFLGNLILPDLVTDLGFSSCIQIFT